MYFLHAINSDRQTRLLNALGQIAMILGDKKKSCYCEQFHQVRSFGFVVINVCNHGEHYETSCILQCSLMHICENRYYLIIYISILILYLEEVLLAQNIFD